MHLIRQKAGSTFSFNVQLAFWIFTLFVLSSNSISYFGTAQGLLRAVLVLFCHATNFYIFYFLFVPNYFLSKKYAQLLLLVFVFFTALTLLRWIIENHFETTIVFPLLASPVKKTGLIFFSEVLVAAFASLLRLSVNAYENRQKLAVLKQVHTETELLFLKSQLNPHFLFNTINNLYALSLEKSDKTPQALLKLSGLLRYYLYECNKDKVPLQKEWQALLAYKELFELKYEKPLHIEMTFDAGPAVMIEPMLLVPLLENCFKHSDIGISNDAFIKVYIHQKEGFLHAAFQNSFSEIQQKKEEPGGIGIASVQKRLELNYADRHRFVSTKTINAYNCELTIYME
jgi:two-component system, LytTR family, sensor kinase